LIQINDDVEIGELDDTWSNAFAGWNLIASIGSYVSFAGLIIFLFGMGYAFARKGAGRLKSLGRRRMTLE
jgi:cytochrome c oxidase subunit 1